MQADAAREMIAAVAARRRGRRSARKGRDLLTALTSAPPLDLASSQASPPSPGPPTYDLDSARVLAAVESLYQEELKPFGRILRKRVAELVGPDERPNPSDVDIDAGRLREVCEASGQLVVQEEEGGDWSACLVGVVGAFVDVYSPADLYPCELWNHLASYFGDLGPDEMMLPGGRYACAQELIYRNLPFLADYSIGQVCHIVQLAISQKKLLGYLNGSVVPYQRSQSIVKEQCAACQQPTGQSSTDICFASWESARSGLRTILQSPRIGIRSAVPLSNVKRLFRSKLHMELSETMLGYSKLSDLLQDDRFTDICSVHLERNGYTVIPQGTTDTLATADCICHDESSIAAGAGRQGLAEPRRVSFGTCASPIATRSGAFAEADGVPLAMNPSSSIFRSPAMQSFTSSPLVLGFHIDDHTQNHAWNQPTMQAGVAAGAGKRKEGVFDAEPSIALSHSLANRRCQSTGVGSNATPETTDGSSDDDSIAGSASTASVEACAQWPLIIGNAAYHRPPPGLLKPMTPSGLRCTGQTLHLACLL